MRQSDARRFPQAVPCAGGRAFMFFYPAKVFWFIVQPSGLLLIMMVAGAVLPRFGHERAARRLLLASILVRFARADLAAAPVSGIVVLGGGEDARVWAGRHTHALNEAGERFTEALALARRFPSARIVFTGGAVEIVSAPKIGADAARAVFADLGLGEGDRLILESRARDTWENAVLVKALVAPKPGERWLLLTSAWHMPRAMGVFRRAGFAVEAWPVDYRTADAWDAVRLFDAPSDGLKRLDTAVREWVGLVAYRLTGRSDALFPGP